VGFTKQFRAAALGGHDIHGKILLILCIYTSGLVLDLVKKKQMGKDKFNFLASILL
jgi:hypothetical protein